MSVCIYRCVLGVVLINILVCNFAPQTKIPYFTPEYMYIVPVWFQRLCICVFIFDVFLFFFFSPHLLTFQRQNSLFMNSACTVHALCMHYHTFKNIKNWSHDTIHTFKNYFATVFSVSATISSIQTDQ